MSAARTPDPPAATRGREQSSGLLTAGQVAERWQVPKCHVYRLTREGQVPAVKLGRYYRYRLDAIDAFEREGGAPND